MTVDPALTDETLTLPQVDEVYARWQHRAAARTVRRHLAGAPDVGEVLHMLGLDDVPPDAEPGPAPFTRAGSS